jgi:LDH2 family malate/lactate/ureidoglycolate dehydrogenase
MPDVPEAQLRRFAGEVLRAAGLSAEDAEVAADCLVSANLRGVDSHGVLRLIQYVDSIASGAINPRPDVRIVERFAATALVDADHGYGFRPSLLAMDTAVALAREYGIAVAGVRDSHHFGMAATYALRAAAEGMLGVVATNTMPVLAAPGGARPVVGNNPLALAVPRRTPAHPIVLDMALSQVAFGYVRLAAAEGREIPLGWARDGEGRATTDAAAALESGSLEPVAAHKGYGLALVLELLAGALTGSPVGAGAHPHQAPGVGHTMIALDPAVFAGRDGFLDAVETLIDGIRAAPLAADAQRVFLPGELEQDRAATRRRDGVPLSDELAGKLALLAGGLGLDTPTWAP